MARRTTSNVVKSEPALLAKPREEVRAQLLTRIQGGNELRERVIRTTSEIDTLEADFSRWNDFNYEFLRRAFTTEEYAQTYRSTYAPIGIAFQPKSPQEKLQDELERITVKVGSLVSLVERLDLIDEGPDAVAANRPSISEPLATGPVNIDNKKVFLVHGQDEEAKAVVARFITGCNLTPIILHEQPNGGRTIIEKFEREADVGFAVIILTPDDVGGLRDGDTLTSVQLNTRARQNVVLELGYFAGRLGRGRVAALKKGDLEMPSDIAGVVWTALDAADAWKMSLARELKSAGFEFDVAQALGI